MTPAPADFGDQGLSPDLAFHITHGTTDHAALGHRPGKGPIDPGQGRGRGLTPAAMLALM